MYTYTADSRVTFINHRYYVALTLTYVTLLLKDQGVGLEMIFLSSISLSLKIPLFGFAGWITIPPHSKAQVFAFKEWIPTVALSFLRIPFFGFEEWITR